MRRWPIAAAAAACLAMAACSREPAAPQTPAAPIEAPAAGPAPDDPRGAFESRSWLAGAPAALESGQPRLVLGGRTLAGPASIGPREEAGSPTIAVAMQGPGGPELLVVDAEGERIAVQALTANPLILAPASGAVLLSCDDGSLACFELAAAESGRALVKRWAIADRQASLLLVLPGPASGGAAPRVAAAFVDGGMECLELAQGHRLWRAELGAGAADLAYAKGLVLACTAGTIAAYGEADGALAWKRDAPDRPLVLAAGEGMAVSIGAGGRLRSLGAADGELLAEAEGRYDPAIRPALDSGQVFAARRGGGAARIDSRTGRVEASWDWPAPTSFLALDESRLFASSGSRLVARKRFAEGEPGDLELPSAPVGEAGELVAGEGRLFLACSGGLAVLGPRESRLDAALAPSAEVKAAIEGALGDMGGELLAGKEPTYGELVSGLPIYPPEGFSVLRYEQAAGGRKAIVASPDPGDCVLVAFDERGVKIAASVDELGAPGSLSLWFEGGRGYWIAAGGSGGRAEGGFALELR